jgi:uncharacterized membrane protein YfcA
VDLDPALWTLLVVAAGAAGWVDAIAGGGGLIQLPCLLAAGVPVPAALGVNKVSSICGTSVAVARYARNGSVRWRDVAVAGPLALAASAAGASALLAVVKAEAAAVRPFFAGCFLALAAQQAWKVWRGPQAPGPGVRSPRVALLFVALIGFYDGLVGPGTGMFLFWAFTTWLAHAPLDATGTTKAVNGLTNLGALATFVVRGEVIWPLGLAMASANVLGGWLGAHAAIRRGVTFIRLLTAAVSAAAAVYLLVAPRT